MDKYAALSDDEINVLVAERCDGCEWRARNGRGGALVNKIGNVLSIRGADGILLSYVGPVYATSFDAVMRTYRALADDTKVGTTLSLIFSDKCDGALGRWLLDSATPRDICEAILEAKEVTP